MYKRIIVEANRNYANRLLTFEYRCYFSVGSSELSHFCVTCQGAIRPEDCKKISRCTTHQVIEHMVLKTFKSQMQKKNYALKKKPENLIQTGRISSSKSKRQRWVLLFLN
jgi:hypothetical protein